MSGEQQRLSRVRIRGRSDGEVASSPSSGSARARLSFPYSSLDPASRTIVLTGARTDGLISSRDEREKFRRLLYTRVNNRIRIKSEQMLVNYIV